jgi:Leucine-rich repeat (LRR) protein
VFEVPQLSQIASLDGSKQIWSDDAIRALANSSELHALRWLDLSHGGITETQVEILAASPSLRNVEMIDLSENPTRNPVDGSAGAGWDWMSGKIEFDSIALPQFGVELEHRYGEITWLHALRKFLEAYPPSRYSF